MSCVPCALLVGLNIVIVNVVPDNDTLDTNTTLPYVKSRN